MIKTLLDYSKAKFHLEQLKYRASYSLEDQGIDFLYSCMNEHLNSSELDPIKFKYKKLIETTLPNKCHFIKTKNKKFYIFNTTKENAKEILVKDYNKKIEELEVSFVENLNVFLTQNNNLFIPALPDLTKENIYLGKYLIFID